MEGMYFVAESIKFCLIGSTRGRDRPKEEWRLT